MKKPAAAKTRRPRIDTVKNLAAGIRRALQESGWSERGLAMAAGLKADRLRNVGRGLSSTLPAAVLDRVADVLTVSAAALTGAEPWPADGARSKRSEPPPELQAAASPPGSLAELAAEARMVAEAARAAIAVAASAAEAAARVAARAEAAAAAPPESAEAVFDRWTAEAEADRKVESSGAARATEVKSVSSRATKPEARLATKDEVAADPGRYRRADNIGRTPKKAYADPLTHLELHIIGNLAYQIDHKLRNITITRSLPDGGRTGVVFAVVLPDGIRLHDLERNVDLGNFLDVEEAGQAAVHWGQHRVGVASTRRQWPEACAFMRTLGAGESAETSHADEIQWIPSSTAIKTLRALATKMSGALHHSGLGGGFHGRARVLAEEGVSAFVRLVAAAEAAGRVDMDSLKSAAVLADEMATRIRNHFNILLDSPVAMDTQKLADIAVLLRGAERLRELVSLPADAPELAIPPLETPSEEQPPRKRRAVKRTA